MFLICGGFHGRVFHEYQKHAWSCFSLVMAIRCSVPQIIWLGCANPKILINVSFIAFISIRVLLTTLKSTITTKPMVHSFYSVCVFVSLRLKVYVCMCMFDKRAVCSSKKTTYNLLTLKKSYANNKKTLQT